MSDAASLATLLKILAYGFLLVLGVLRLRGIIRVRMIPLRSG
jgi:hypothetical protein